VTHLNESRVGNQSDSQRAYAAAQALLDAAQRDIRQNGPNCNAPYMGASGKNDGVACTLRFPRDQPDYNRMLHGSNTSGKTEMGTCAKTAPFEGVCFSSGPTDPDVALSAPNLVVTDSSQLSTTDGSGIQTLLNGLTYNNTYIAALDGVATGVDYGQGVKAGGGTSDPSLALGSRGQYWIEIFPYNINSSALNGGPAGGADTMSVPVPDLSYPFVFRITARATGLRDGSVSVLRTYYVPLPQQIAAAS
jgi:type IV pilus assembly protein PilX